MKKAVTIWAIEGGITGDLDLIESMKTVSQANFDGLELSYYKTGQISKDYTTAFLNYIKKESDKIGIKLTSLSSLLFNEYNLISNDKSERILAYKTIVKMLEIASLLELKTVSFSPGRMDRDISYLEGYSRGVESLHSLGRIAKNMGVDICIENVDQKFLTSPLEFSNYLNEINHKNVKACLDIGNTTLCGYPNHWIELLKSKIGKIHLTDTRIRMGKLVEFVPVGTGMIEWSKILPDVAEHYSEYATVEAFFNPKLTENQLLGISNRLDEILKMGDMI